jgi:hypothetical protein
MAATGMLIGLVRGMLFFMAAEINFRGQVSQP